MERTRFAVAIEAVPIEETKRRVAGLLNLGDENSFAERVDGARFEKDAIAHARLELVEARVAGARGEFALESHTIDARFEAGVDFAPRFGGQHDPGFRLAEIGRSESGRLRVVGMHLHRERQLGVEEFQEQRKLPLRMVPAEEFLDRVR